MQYELDTRLQALFTYSISADDRLARKALYDFHSSLMPTGILQSRCPSVGRQVIPGFALYWIRRSTSSCRTARRAHSTASTGTAWRSAFDWRENKSRLTHRSLVRPSSSRMAFAVVEAVHGKKNAKFIVESRRTHTLCSFQSNNAMTA